MFLQHVLENQSAIQKKIQTDKELQELRQTSRDTPYEINSQMIIEYLGQTSYDKMLTSEYDRKFKEKMESVDFHRFQDPIFLFRGMIQPENL